MPIFKLFSEGLVFPEQSKPQGLSYSTKVIQAPVAVVKCSSNSNTNGVLYASTIACSNQCINMEGQPGSCTQIYQS